MAWVQLVLAGLFEIVWAVALKQAGGFTRLWPSVLAVVSAFVSFALLSAALQSLPVGTAYAVWVGIGAVGVASVGILALGESAAPARILCLVLVLGGTVGLHLMEQ
jgi:quaternary ammonium compound-resistance protein SugE